MKRRIIGMTSIELLVSVLISTVMIVTLIPVFSESRGVASQQASQGELSIINMALGSYVYDNNGYTPVNSAVNGGDFTPRQLGQSPAGKDIWGIPPIHGGGNYPQYYQGNPPTNYPLGYGTLKDQGYLSLELMWSRAERTEDNYSYSRAMYFGSPYMQPWSDAENNEAGPWSPWYGGGNYWMSGSYTFRSGDWSTFTFIDKLPVKGIGGNYNEGAFRDTNILNTRPTTAGYTNKSIVVENSGISHFPKMGANVLVGDGSIVFWNSPEHAIGVYTKNYLTTYPRNTASGDLFHNGFRSLVMDAADKFRE